MNKREWVLAALALAGQTAQAATFEYIGQQQWATGFAYAGTQAGGLSGIEFDPSRGSSVAISDDRPPITPFDAGPLDPESIRLAAAGHHDRSNEGDDGSSLALALAGGLVLLLRWRVRDRQA